MKTNVLIFLSHDMNATQNMIIENSWKPKENLIELKHFHPEEQWNKVTQDHSQDEPIYRMPHTTSTTVCLQANTVRIQDERMN